MKSAICIALAIFCGFMSVKDKDFPGMGPATFVGFIACCLSAIAFY